MSRQPIIGDVVHFYDASDRQGEKPQAAIVVDLDHFGNPSLRVFARRGTNDVYYYGVPHKSETHPAAYSWDWKHPELVEGLGRLISNGEPQGR